MLTPKEQKITVETLNKRRAWLKKSIEDDSSDAHARKELLESLKLLDSALQKISKISPQKLSEPASTAAPTAKPQPKNPTQKRKVTREKARFLIAEDNKDAADLLVQVLTDFGLKDIDLATDGKEAFDKIKSAQEPYDMILCDWDMPELSGIEVYDKASASNTLKGAHFVMVTAISDATRIRSAVQKGVNDYVVKPIDVDSLGKKIDAALGLTPQ